MPTRRRATLLGSLFAALATHGAASDVQTFSRDSAVVDEEIPASVRLELADDDGRPMKSVSVDLNNDNHPEKLIPNEFLCGNGGCPWLVYSPIQDKVIGRMDAKRITILDATTAGYRTIRATWTVGDAEAESRTYEFRHGAYEGAQIVREIVPDVSEEETVRATLDSIDLCYHWAEEAGDGGDERAAAIDEGFSRDCPDAQSKARKAHARYPGNQALALGLLKLNDIGYFDLAVDEQDALCLVYSSLARKEFLGSQRKDWYFEGFCPAQASRVYER